MLIDIVSTNSFATLNIFDFLLFVIVLFQKPDPISRIYQSKIKKFQQFKKSEMKLYFVQCPLSMVMRMKEKKSINQFKIYY